MIELIETIFVVLGASLIYLGAWYLFLVGLIELEDSRSLRNPGVLLANIIVWTLAFGLLGELVYKAIKGYTILSSHVFATLIIALTPIIALLTVVVGEEP